MDIGGGGGRTGPAQTSFTSTLLALPSINLGVEGAKNMPVTKTPAKSWHFVHLENKVYLVDVTFGSKNLEKNSAPARYFFVQHF